MEIAVTEAAAQPDLRASDSIDVESAVRRTARQLFSLMNQSKASLLSQERWQSEIMDWAMRDERLKVELFRFVDVFPTLRSREEIDGHMREYFDQPGLDTPRLLRMGLTASSNTVVSPLATAVIRRQMVAFAQRFIVGRDAADALPKLRGLRDRGTGFTLDVLGEATVSDQEARDYQQRYLELLDGLQREVASWKDQPVIDRAAWGDVPRVNVSIKITSLFSQIDDMNFRGSATAIKDRLRPIFRKARDTGAFVNLDLEQFRYRDLTYTVFKELLDEDEFHDYDQAGVVVQAYLRDSEDDIRSLIEWARERSRVITVRLVKGAYWDYETVLAGQEGWPTPVFTHKPDSDVMYERITRIMLENSEQIRSAFASHNVRSLANAIAVAEASGVRRDAYELQMLHGMGEPIKAAVRKMGLRLREYAPVGEAIPGMAYFVRRLLENTANESFLRLTFAEGKEVEGLIEPPRPSLDVDQLPQRLPALAPTDVIHPGPFENQPRGDFSRVENREAFAAALAEVQSGRVSAGLGNHWPLWIDGQPVETSGILTSINPARPAEVIGTVAFAGEAEAGQAVRACVRAFPAWRETPAAERAAVLLRSAEIMRSELFELAALEVFEAGKTWREADADVGEAIDFLEYYGREMLRLAGIKGQEAGELSHDYYRPRGVGVVIAPWNFPLAILTGMTSAALVTGNAVIVKPAGPTPVIGAQLVRILHAAGAPPGTVNFLPSPGGTVGDLLVRHPDVDVIAFTGSKEVGLNIIGEAAQHHGRRGVKRVIAEMGGKNAIIVDDDADMDVAVLESIASAFHYQGQKCSAASRIIVLKGAYDEFVRRFVDAARSLVVGLPEDPASRMGPVISAEAKEKIEAYIELGKRECRPALVTSAPAGGWPSDGFFVGPHVFVDVKPGAAIAQEEIFGPVVAVMQARDLDEALAIANGTQYALTGGLISRSPANIRRVRHEFRVGNLYINRGITGALVERQPFGGFKMSGIGSKAGGPDYLSQFMDCGNRDERHSESREANGLADTVAQEEEATCRGSEPTAWAEGECITETIRRKVDDAVASATAAFVILRDVPVRGRAAAVSRAAQLIRHNSRELQARLLGESPLSGAGAVRVAAAEVEGACLGLERISDLILEVDCVRRMGHQPGELNHYFYQPRGVAVVLSSSQHPLITACTMVGAALAAGNPVVLKPGSGAFLSSAFLAQMLSSIDLPPGSVGFLPISGKDLGGCLVGHPGVDLVALAGSEAVALQVVAAAGQETAGGRVKRVLADFNLESPRAPDAAYLLQFLEPRVVTENTLRRGFAPPEELLDTVR